MIALVVCGAAFFILKLLFPSDTVRIRKLMTRLERAASVAPGESQLVSLGRVQTLRELFAAECQVVVDAHDYGKLEFLGRDELLQAVSAAIALRQSIHVKFAETSIRVGESKTNAAVEVAAVIRTGQRRGETLVLLKVLVKKRESDWLITRVESIRSLQM